MLLQVQVQEFKHQIEPVFRVDHILQPAQQIPSSQTRMSTAESLNKVMQWSKAAALRVLRHLLPELCIAVLH